jgi:hypothetical protein
VFVSYSNAVLLRKTVLIQNKVKVKQSLYRPVQALSVAGVSGSQIS